jgi:hypothetical protein
MPYSCPVSLLVIEGETLPDLTGILWGLWGRSGTGTGSGLQQAAQEDVVVSSTAPINLTFTGGPDNSDVGRDIGLSLQETPGVAGSTGWLFRSGRLDSLPVPPPTLDVVICPAVRFSAGPDRTAYGLLSENVTVYDLPLSLADGATRIVTVTAASVDGGFVLTVAGTSPAAFSHSVTVTLWPSDDQQSLTRVLEWNAVDTGTDTGIVTTAARNFTRRLVTDVVSDIVRIVGRVAIQNLAAVVIPAPAPGTESGPLDPGVVLSIRRVVATASGLAILPALGAFGSVVALQFPERVSAPSSGKCALTSMVTLLELPLNLHAFRAYRDTVLRQTPSGRNAIETYYREAPSALGVISSDPTLLAAVGDLVVRFERDLALNGVLSRKTRQMVEKFVADLEARGPRYLAGLAREACIQYRGAT